MFRTFSEYFSDLIASSDAVGTYSLTLRIHPHLGGNDLIGYQLKRIGGILIVGCGGNSFKHGNRHGLITLFWFLQELVCLLKQKSKLNFIFAIIGPLRFFNLSSGDYTPPQNRKEGRCGRKADKEGSRSSCALIKIFSSEDKDVEKSKHVSRDSYCYHEQRNFFPVSLTQFGCNISVVKNAVPLLRNVVFSKETPINSEAFHFGFPRFHGHKPLIVFPAVLPP
ncbi:hypothetical protein FIV06_16945 [Labrenzia sp. THAF191b]|nr:hypothetical protein FIV06_16945 [Labrenzia sp. THAF191b]QFT05435.1 hypothetical protein FIV05_16940 [Labrenzia sp. THAF191a]QFT16979.1 hypothetical protein FIV03_16955 [Labrenzia sp. THAF187b]